MRRSPASPLPRRFVNVAGWDPTALFLIRPALVAVAAGALSIGSRPSPGPARQDGVSITFLANEGVLLSSGPRKVLIDGLFLKYESGYAVPADSTRVALERARPPFDAVDLVLVTHRHGDHFHPAPVAAHLRANPRATLLTSRQVIDSLRGRVSASALLAPRFMARTTAPGTRRREVVAGIAVELLGLPHGGRKHRGVEHLGYVVELGGRRVLHVGDTEFTEATFAPFRLDTARIDVALLPYGAVTSREGRRVIERWIRPRQVVAFHVGEGETERVARAVQAALPGAVTFVRSLDTRRW
jgi:L-ascorbate metabolism protein UlaG (beta-lactamase superfamily)